MRGRTIAGLPFRVALLYLGMLAAALVLYSVWWQGAPFLTHDSEGYMEAARDLADGQLDYFHMRPPGYPLLLLLTGATVQPTRALFYAGLALHGLSIWLLALILVRSGLRERWVALFGAVALLPPFVELAAEVLTENLSQTLLIAGFYCLTFGTVRGRVWLLAVAGLLFAWAALSHPLYQALTPALVAALFLICCCFFWARLKIRRAILSSGVTFGLCALILAGYSAFNARHFGFFGVSAFTGYALSGKTVTVLERLPKNYGPVREALIAARDADLTKPGSSHTAASYIWRAEAEVSRLTGLKDAALAKYLQKLYLGLVKDAPLVYAEEVGLAIVGFWLPTVGELAGGSTFLQASWSIFSLAVFAAFALQLLILCGATTLAVTRRLVPSSGRSTQQPFVEIKVRTLSYTFAVATIGYAVMISGLFGAQGISRYRSPVALLIVFACFLGWDMCWRMVRPLRSRVSAGAHRPSTADEGQEIERVVSAATSWPGDHPGETLRRSAEFSRQRGK